MSVGNGAVVAVAAGAAAGLVETIVHPLDTVITRIQSADALHYQKAQRCVTRSGTRNLYLGLYQGFGPTVIASIPASIAFFATYEFSRAAFEDARRAGNLQYIPQPVSYAASSAVAELVACAIINPAQVLKQNAQVVKRVHGQPKSSPTAQVIRQFANRPSTLWTGYSVLAAGQLPCISLTFCIYESLKSSLLAKPNWQRNDTVQQVQASAVCAAIAGCCSSWAFVPADVIRTRMRLAIANDAPPRVAPKAFAIASQIIRREGISALFRGSILSCIAAGVGTAVYLGSYEAIKLHIDTVG